MSLLKLISVLTLAVAFTHATITIQTQNLIGNTTNTIHWTSSDLDTDPESFSIELNHPSFHHLLAIGNNVPNTDSQFTFEMPDVLPQGGYSLDFVGNGNVTDIIAQSGTFFVIENDITGPHTGLVSPTLPPPSPSTASSLTSSTLVSNSSTSSTTFSTPAPSSSSPTLPPTTPVVVIPNPSATSGNSSIINGPTNGAGALEIPLAATFLVLAAWIL